MKKLLANPAHRILSLIVVAAIIFSGVPMSAAAETGCTHTHDEDCGYTEAVACTHECGEDCAEGCVHEHDDTCGYTEAAPCTHEHDENCGGLSQGESGGEGEAATPGVTNGGLLLDGGDSCVCTAFCDDPECPVCKDDATQCFFYYCVCEVLCGEDSVNADCPICKDDYASCVQAVEASEIQALAVGEPTMVGNSIYANGTPVIIKADGSTTKIYKSSDPNNALFSNADIRGHFIYGGWESGENSGDTSVTVESTEEDSELKIYGGSYEGTLTGDTSVTIGANASIYYVFGGGWSADLNGSTNVTVNGGTVTTTIFGGGEQGSVTGNTSVSIDNNTNANTVGGGGWESSATVGGDTTVEIDGGTYNFICGGGVDAAVTGQTSLIINGATVNVAVYGGGRNAGATVGSTSVEIDDGTYGWIYGGGDGGSVTGNASVTIDNAIVTGTVYGGGNSADVNGSASVEIEESTVTGWVYGGGGYGSVTDNTSVTLTDATVGETIFGGGGWDDSVTIGGNSSVEIDGGTYAWVYGGGDSGPVTGEASVSIKNATVTGGVFGGGGGWNDNDATVGSTTVTIESGTVGDVYGGGEEANVTGAAIVNIYPEPTITGSITFGGYAADATVGYGSKVNYWYKVKYDLNTGSGTAPTESGTNNGYVAAGASAFTAAATTSMTPPSGKQFKEWNTQDDGQGTNYAVGGNVTIATPTAHPYEDFTLYAIWETSTLTNLNTPTGLALSGAGVAIWNTVTNAASYSVQLYKDGAKQGAAVPVTTGTSHNFLSAIHAAGIGTYNFTVVAVANPATHSNSAESSQAGSFVLKKIASIITPAAITKPVGTPEGSAGLPSAVSATLNSGTANIPVTWAGYNSSAAGTFTLTGTLGTLPNDVINPDSVTCPGLSITFTASTITLSANPAAGGSVSGGGTFASGTSRTVTATANATYQFVNWTEGGTVVSTDASYTFTLTTDRTLVANFVTSGNVDVGTDPQGGAPATSLPDSDAVLGAVLEPQDITDINNGSTITVTLEVEDKTPPDTDPDKQAVTGALGTKSVGMYLDISMFKQKDSDPKQPITQLNAPILIEFDVPANLRNANRTFSVIRVHNGSADVLPNLSGNSNKIRFETDRFSTYAIAYQDAAAPTNPPSSGGGSSSGGGGGSDRSDTVSTVVSTYWIEVAEAKEMAKSAKGKELDYVRSRRATITGIRKNSLLALAKDSLLYQHDTVEGNAVQVRVYVNDPAKAAKDILVSGYVKGNTVDKVKARFEKWFTNKLAVINLDQEGDFGMQVGIAAKVDLTGMDVNNLYFYSYDKATNKYTRIQTEYRIDTNGYLHFATILAGDIIVSSGPLTKKTAEQIAADGDKYYYLSAASGLEEIDTSDGGGSMFSAAELPVQETPQNPNTGGDSPSYMDAVNTPLKLEISDNNSGGALIINLDAPVILDAAQKGSRPSALLIGGIAAAVLLASMMLWAVIPRKDDPLVSLEEYRKNID